MATLAACAGVFPGLVPEVAGAGPGDDFFAIADLASRSLSRELAAAESSDSVVVTVVDKSELKEIGAVGFRISVSLTSPRTMSSSGFRSDRCVRIHSARTDPCFSQGGERHPGAAPRRIR